MFRDTPQFPKRPVNFGKQLPGPRSCWPTSDDPGDPRGPIGRGNEADGRHWVDRRQHGSVGVVFTVDLDDPDGRRQRGQRQAEEKPSQG